MKRRRGTSSAIGSALVWIDNQRRIEVSREPVSSALNLTIRAGETIHVWALSGAQSQLQLLPPDSDLAQIRDRLDQGSGRKTVSWDASEDADVATCRQLEGFFKIACHARKGGNTLRLTLPADVIDLGYFECGDPLMIFWSGEVLELWPKDRWRQSIANRDLRELLRRARRAM